MELNQSPAIERRRFLKVGASLAPLAGEAAAGQAGVQTPRSLGQNRASAQGGSARRVPISLRTVLGFLPPFHPRTTLTP